MEKTRDIALAPMAGDIISKPSAAKGRGPVRRMVTRVEGFTIYYKTAEDAKEKNCWITTWSGWANGADVERRGDS